jgi:hypothetical protein
VCIESHGIRVAVFVEMARKHRWWDEGSDADVPGVVAPAEEGFDPHATEKWYYWDSF